MQLGSVSVPCINRFNYACLRKHHRADRLLIGEIREGQGRGSFLSPPPRERGGGNGVTSRIVGNLGSCWVCVLIRKYCYFGYCFAAEAGLMWQSGKGARISINGACNRF